jgi:hypothetical protein
MNNIKGSRYALLSRTEVDDQSFAMDVAPSGNDSIADSQVWLTPSDLYIDG